MDNSLLRRFPRKAARLAFEWEIHLGWRGDLSILAARFAMARRRQLALQPLDSLRRSQAFDHFCSDRVAHARDRRSRAHEARNTRILCDF